MFQKQKRKKKKKKFSFITQYKIEFLLPFTGCRKVLGKMPDEEEEPMQPVQLNKEN